MLPFAHIQFDNVRLDESWRLSGPARGFSQLLAFFRIWPRFRLCDGFRSGSSCWMDDAVKWAGERKAFGKSVSEFQQVQEMLTDMEVKLANMRHGI